ncbi:hypothetical protein ABZT06_08615 [Streptomyces sp. NPDC005483]|uniref:hypothetical protein n=1 Tax=Streptomyces sp. NPDC005483 TaxID=3154882 RepID=UPI0033BB3042
MTAAHHPHTTTPKGTPMTDHTPPTNQQLDEIEARAAYLEEYATLTDGPLQADADQLWGNDVGVLLAEVRHLRASAEPVTVPTKDTPLSEYDFVELVAFAHKVESEGFGYAFEEYPPRFEAPELDPIADDYSLLRQLFDEWEEALDEFWTRPDAEAAYDAHIDEARRRRREQRDTESAAP